MPTNKKYGDMAIQLGLLAPERLNQVFEKQAELAAQGKTVSVRLILEKSKLLTPAQLQRVDKALGITVVKKTNKLPDGTPRPPTTALQVPLTPLPSKPAQPKVPQRAPIPPRGPNYGNVQGMGWSAPRNQMQHSAPMLSPIDSSPKLPSLAAEFDHLEPSDTLDAASSMRRNAAAQETSPAPSSMRAPAQRPPAEAPGSFEETVTAPAVRDDEGIETATASGVYSNWDGSGPRDGEQEGAAVQDELSPEGTARPLHDYPAYGELQYQQKPWPGNDDATQAPELSPESSPAAPVVPQSQRAPATQSKHTNLFPLKLTPDKPKAPPPTRMSEPLPYVQEAAADLDQILGGDDASSHASERLDIVDPQDDVVDDLPPECDTTRLPIRAGSSKSAKASKNATGEYISATSEDDVEFTGADGQRDDGQADDLDTGVFHRDMAAASKPLSANSRKTSFTQAADVEEPEVPGVKGDDEDTSELPAVRPSVKAVKAPSSPSHPKPKTANVKKDMAQKGNTRTQSKGEKKEEEKEETPRRGKKLLLMFILLLVMVSGLLGGISYMPLQTPFKEILMMEGEIGGMARQINKFAADNLGGTRYVHVVAGSSTDNSSTTPNKGNTGGEQPTGTGQPSPTDATGTGN